MGVLLELGDPDRILAKELLDRTQREIAPLDVNQFGRRTSLADHRAKIGIRGHDGIAVLPGPIPDRPVIRVPEVDITHTGQPGEQGRQARNQSR